MTMPATNATINQTVAELTSYLNDYCERSGVAGLWAEPLNAVTNLFFILAAVAAGCMLYKRAGGITRAQTNLWLLIVALFSIGIGSGLWHTIPTATTVLMDVIPITIFIHLYLIATFRRVLQFSWKKTGFWWAVYFAISLVAQATISPYLFHGSILYIPTYCTLIVLSLVVRQKDRAVGRVYFAMLALWTVSLICRTVDLDICGQFHWGTHFLWHTLNAIMLYRFLTVHIERLPARG